MRLLKIIKSFLILSCLSLIGPQFVYAQNELVEDKITLNEVDPNFLVTYDDLRQDNVDRSILIKRMRLELMTAHALALSVDEDDIWDNLGILPKYLPAIFDPNTQDIEVCLNKDRDDLLPLFVSRKLEKSHVHDFQIKDTRRHLYDNAYQDAKSLQDEDLLTDKRGGTFDYKGISDLNTEVFNQCKILQVGTFELEHSDDLPGVVLLNNIIRSVPITGVGRNKNLNTINNTLKVIVGFEKEGSKASRDYYLVYLTTWVKGGLFIEVRRYGLEEGEDEVCSPYELLALNDGGVPTEDDTWSLEKISLLDPNVQITESLTSYSIPSANRDFFPKPQANSQVALNMESLNAYLKELSVGKDSFSALSLDKATRGPTLITSDEQSENLVNTPLKSKDFYSISLSQGFPSMKYKLDPEESLDYYERIYLGKTMGRIRDDEMMNISHDPSRIQNLKDKLYADLNSVLYKGVSTDKLKVRHSKLSHFKAQELELLKESYLEEQSQSPSVFEMAPVIYSFVEPQDKLKFGMRFYIEEPSLKSSLLFYKWWAHIKHRDLENGFVRLDGDNDDLEQGVREIIYQDGKISKLVQYVDGKQVIDLKNNGDDNLLEGVCANLRTRRVAREEYGCSLVIQNSRDLLRRPLMLPNTEVKRIRNDGSLFTLVEIKNGKAVLEERYSHDGFLIYSRGIKQGLRHGETVRYYGVGPLQGKPLIKATFNENFIEQGQCVFGRELIDEELKAFESAKPVFCNPFAYTEDETSKQHVLDNISDVRDFFFEVFTDKPRYIPLLFRDNFQNAETWQTLVDFNELDKLLGKRDRLSLKDITLENIHPHEGEKAPNYEVLIRRDPKWGIIITAFLSEPTLEEGYFVYKAVELVEKRPDKSLISIIRLQNKCQNYWHLTGLIEKSIYNEYKEGCISPDSFISNLRSIDTLIMNAQNHEVMLKRHCPYQGNAGVYFKEVVKDGVILEYDLISDYIRWQAHREASKVKLTVLQNNHTIFTSCFDLEAMR